MNISAQEPPGMSVGLEVEAFDDPHEDCFIEAIGEISRDAAPDLIELIGDPCNSHDEAIAKMRALAEYLTSEASFGYVRPCSRESSADTWRPNVRYDALRAALIEERGEAGRGVKIMTNRAATHINVGVDWDRPSGVALLSVMNNIAPYLSTALHEEHGVACGNLLRPWNGWARSERFSSPDRWWNTSEELRLFYERVPRLIRPGVGNEPSAVPDLSYNSGKMDATFHLGTMWHFARPKISDRKQRYCELRFVASLDPRTHAFSEIVSTVVELSQCIIVACENGLERADAVDLFSQLRRHGFGQYLPERPLTHEDWDQCSVWHTADYAGVAAA